MSVPLTKSIWVRVADQLPQDGQVVFVRGKYGVNVRRAKFRAKPVGRWDIDDYTYQLEYFEEWAPLP